MSKSSTPSQRQLRVGELIRHALSTILMRGGVMDPDLDGIAITVPEVRMSPDLKIATCFVMPLGGKGGDLVVKALARNARFLRGVLARDVDLRYMPQLRFLLDTSFDEGDHIDRLLRSPGVARDLEQEPKDG